MSNERKPYHHGNSHEELLGIAVRIGREKGPDAITVRQVTREAGVSPTSAYRHFKDQQALLNAVAGVALDTLMKRIHSAIQAAPKENNSAERLLRAGWAYLNFALEEPDFFRCLYSTNRVMMPMTFGDFEKTMSEFPVAVRELQQDVLQNAFFLITQFALEKDGDFKIETIAPNILSAWSTVHGFTVLVAEGFISFESAEHRSHVAAIVFANALRGINFSNPEDISDTLKHEDINIFQALTNSLDDFSNDAATAKEEDSSQ